MSSATSIPESDAPSGVTRRTVLGGAGAALGVAATGGVLALTAAPASAAIDYTSLVEPKIGTDGVGSCVIGAHHPFGFAKPSPDCVPSYATTGYLPDRDIVGFSQTHVSGTGGGSKYGNFRITPWVGSPTSVAPDTAMNTGGRVSNEYAAPGYYTVVMTRGTAPDTTAITTELTASKMCAVHKYTFPANQTATLYINAASIIEKEWGQYPIACEVKFNGTSAIEITATFQGGWNSGRYKLHGVVVLSRTPSSYGTFQNNAVQQSNYNGFNLQNMHGGVEWQENPARPKVGAYVSYNGTAEKQVVEVRLALSFVSVTKAWDNFGGQVNGKSFWDVQAGAQQAWVNALGQIETVGGSDAQRKMFYTALYHSHAMPHDLTGENAWWSNTTPHYEDYYALWDTFRTLHPLLTLIQPKRQAEMVQSLVETYTYKGWMPDARIAGNAGLTQGGSNGDVVVADAYVKGLPGINFAEAYQALKQNADVESPDPGNYGRRMTNYRDDNQGWIPLDQRSFDSSDNTSTLGRSASRTLEYNYNDFCVAKLADTYDSGNATRFRSRANGWWQLWDYGTSSIRPKYQSGTWLTPFTRTTNYSRMQDPFYEGTAYRYSTFVPHDTQGVINRVGGDAGYVGWLDELFNSGQYAQDNEPDMLAAWLYIHAGRPDKTALRVRTILKNSYGIGRNGVPGNDDSGAMSSWAVFAAIGLFPNAGQPYYYIGSPIFTETRLKVTGGTFTVKAPATSDTNIYVQSAKLNGVALNRAWCKHSEVVTGGNLELVMGSSASTWATGRGKDNTNENVRPFSVSTPW